MNILSPDLIIRPCSEFNSPEELADFIDNWINQFENAQCCSLNNYKLCVFNNYYSIPEHVLDYESLLVHCQHLMSNLKSS